MGITQWNLHHKAFIHLENEGQEIQIRDSTSVQINIKSIATTRYCIIYFKYITLVLCTLYSVLCTLYSRYPGRDCIEDDHYDQTECQRQCKVNMS